MIQATNYLISGGFFFKLLFSLICLHNPRNTLVLEVRGEDRTVTWDGKKVLEVKVRRSYLHWFC